MDEASNPLVFWIVVPLFAAVGIHLLIYGRQRKRMMEGFARAHGFRVRPELENALEQALDRCVALDAPGLVRTFSRLASIVDAGPIRLFRCIELLDLVPYAQASSTHFPRLAATFDVAGHFAAFFLLDRSGQASPRVPGAPPPEPRLVEAVTRAAASCRARYTLSVTLARGRAVIYFEPSVTGGETRDDLEALYCIARSLRQELANNV